MPQQNNIYTVKELNERIQELVSGEPWLGSLGVEGEITGLGTDKRGHMLSLIHILDDVRDRAGIRRLVENRVFERYVVLGGDKAGQISDIFDGQGNRLCWYD